MDWKPLIDAVREIPELELAEHSLGAGEQLFEQGDAAGSMYLLTSGRLESARRHDPCMVLPDRGPAVGEVSRTAADSW